VVVVVDATGTVHGVTTEQQSPLTHGLLDGGAQWQPAGPVQPSDVFTQLASASTRTHVHPPSHGGGVVGGGGGVSTQAVWAVPHVGSDVGTGQGQFAPQPFVSCRQTQPPLVGMPT